MDLAQEAVMAIPTRPSPQESEAPTAIFAAKYDELLKRSYRQAALARQMRNQARRMIDNAIEMRRRPFRFVA
jgi:hypothetical protein